MGATLVEAVLNPVVAIASSAVQSCYAARILALGTTFLQTSQLALTKATHPEAKLFANFEAAEQEKMVII